MPTIAETIERCKAYCPAGTRPSAEEALQLVAEIERLRADQEFMKELYEMAADLRYSTEFIGISVRNRLVQFAHEQKEKTPSCVHGVPMSSECDACAESYGDARPTRL